MIFAALGLAAASLALPASAADSVLMVDATRKPGEPWQQFPTRLVGSLPGYTPSPGDPLSPYGGFAPGRMRARATGFFRVAHAGTRWLLVDPEGHPFIDVGLVGVNVPHGSAEANKALAEKFGTHERWAEAAAEFLHGLGDTGTGGWSDDAAIRHSARPLAYTPVWNFMSAYGKRRGGTYQQPGHTGYPKDCIFVFDPEFPAFCDEYAKRLAATKDDPWLLGHYSDNELPFNHKSLDNYLSLPAGDPGRKAAEDWLAQWRGSHPGEQEISDEMRQEFLGFVVDRYLQITTAAIRKYDPNHLCLGPRFHGSAIHEPFVFKAAGRYLDVIAINYYHAWTPDPALTRNWVEWSGRPFLITEWYAKGMDSGFANKSGAGWTVKTQRDRGYFYQNFTLGLLESGGCVGWHWLQYMDNDPADMTTDPSNRDSNKGVVNLRIEPYAPLAEAMTELNRQVYSLAAYFDARKKQTAAP
jgi:hypothetical protein